MPCRERKTTSIAPHIRSHTLVCVSELTSIIRVFCAASSTHMSSRTLHAPLLAHDVVPMIRDAPPSIHLSHLINATGSETLETSDLRYFTVVDVSQHPQFMPSTKQKLLFFARKSVTGQPGAMAVLRSLATVLLTIGKSGRLEPLSDDPVVLDHTLSSNLDVALTSHNGSSNLFALGGHHLAWDERKGQSAFAKHEAVHLRPRDGLHLLRATDLASVLSRAWQPWNQTISPLVLQHGVSRGGGHHGAKTSSAKVAAARALDAKYNRARRSSIVISGRHPGCQEIFDRYAPICYFDSKMSLTHFRDRYYVFARANTVPRGGGRFVQVAVSASDDPGGPYSSFEMIQIAGYSTIRSGNIYTAAIREHPLDTSMLLGLFSVNEGQPGRVNKDGKCYIALSLSCDGKRWSNLTPLIHTNGSKGRTFDQPVTGLLRKGGAVHFFVHRDVPQISPRAPTQSRLERHTFRTSALMRLTTSVKASCSG